MATLSHSQAQSVKRRFTLYKLHDTYRHTLCILILASLLAVGTLVVYLTGGTAYAYPYLMLIPVLLAAAWYRVAGALTVALAAGLLMATMPLNVDTATVQSAANWLIRLGLFLGLGGFAGGLFQSLLRLNQAREKTMHTDPGSGLPNVLALRKSLAQALAENAQKDQATGVILIRLTDITDVLEAMGMDASDELMAAFSTQIISEIPSATGVYRFSDAELMLLLSNVDLLQIERVVRQLIDAGENNLVVQNVPMRTQVVLGSSLTQHGPLQADSLIGEARMAMFAATDKQRNHCHYTPAFKRRTLQTIQLISQVRQGLELGEFELHYQPKIQLSDGQVCGCEGLIRWRNGAGGLIPPGRFMPKVENTTLISPVTRFVAAEAFQFAAGSSGVVSFNFSVRNLFDTSLVTMLHQLLEQTGLPAHRLEVEITESALVQDLVAAKRAVERIRSFGIGVSIDDFGTGFASFEYLQHLPVTGLKIDRAFVLDLEHDDRACKLLACMIDVGHALNMMVTAEGVETQGQHDILRSLGCDQAQGFLYSPALPARAYSDWHLDYTRRNRAAQPIY